MDPKFAEKRRLVIPGPGAYTSDIDKFGKNKSILSKHLSPRGVKIGTEQRDLTKISSSGPGPGSYRLPSEFGYYEKNGIYDYNKDEDQEEGNV